uniref:Uncharacterized protein n=1 Tax=Arundo donax TaxID=35708 RepID=A0A0A8XTP9_ARUDO
MPKHASAALGRAVAPRRSSASPWVPRIAVPCTSSPRVAPSRRVGIAGRPRRPGRCHPAARRHAPRCQAPAPCPCTTSLRHTGHRRDPTVTCPALESRHRAEEGVIAV